MAAIFEKNEQTFKSIAKYLEDSLGFELVALYYVGTYSSNGITPIVHYDIRATLEGASITRFRATVYWNNATDPPTVTRMDVVV